MNFYFKIRLVWPWQPAVSKKIVKVCTANSFIYSTIVLRALGKHSSISNTCFFPVCIIKTFVVFALKHCRYFLKQHMRKEINLPLYGGHFRDTDAADGLENRLA